LPADEEEGEDATLDHALDPADAEGLAEPFGDGDRPQPGAPAPAAPPEPDLPGGEADGRPAEAKPETGEAAASPEPADLWFDDDAAPDWPERTPREDR
jgi:hypothetical protein